MVVFVIPVNIFFIFKEIYEVSEKKQKKQQTVESVKYGSFVLGAVSGKTENNEKRK